MNRKLGPSIVLSLLIVAFFSFVLHQPDERPGPGPKPRPQSAAGDDGTEKIAAERVQSRRNAVISSDSAPRTASPSTSMGAEDDVKPPTAVRYRRIRTVPRDIIPSPGGTIQFRPSASESRLPTAIQPGRWRRIR